MAALVLAPAAHANVGASARPSAPLTVAFAATAPAASYRWDFGDGTTGEGATVEHVYAQPGRYTATLTTEAGQATVEAVAYRLVFEAPARLRYGARGRFTGSIWPSPGRVTVEIRRSDGSLAFRGRTRADGGFVLRGRVRSRGPFRARVAGIASEPDAIALRPLLEARTVGAGVVGRPLRFVARLRPAGAGTIAVTVWRNGRRTHAGAYSRPIGLATRAPATYRIRVALRPAAGYAGVTRTVGAAVLRPRLALGSRGAGVLALEQRLRSIGYALPRVDGWYGYDTYQAVLAFQKVRGLARTGRVDAGVWSAIARSSRPLPRYRGTHLEVSKGRQVLFVVRNSRVETIVHVSTGATGNTPLGRWHIYRKNAGWDWVLWYPMYFLRGFAIHGYPSVPAYPASHGCVRVPMWIAPRLYSQFTYGSTVYVYW
jgi:N-acetylmuramoyl-L-alanine amidase